MSAALRADPPAVAEAIRAGDINAISAYLASGHGVNSPAGDGHRTLLSLAVQARQEAMVEFLIAHGADVNLHDPKPGLLGSYDGVTPIDQAARNDDLEAAKALITHGATVNPEGDDPFGPLINASVRGSSEVAKLLLAKGADINHADVNGATALHHAAKMGRVDMMELLLAHGAKLDQLDHSGDMPLGSALRFGQFAAARALIQHKAPCKSLDLADHTLLDLAILSPATAQIDGGLLDQLLGCGVDLHAGKRLTLWYAIAQRNVAVARLLVSKGADIPTSQIPYGDPLLHLVVQNSLGAELLGDLLKKGLDVNGTNHAGQTPLLALDLVRGQPATDGRMIELLLAHGASINAADNRGYTLLHYAALANGDTGPWVDYLVSKGARVDVKGTTDPISDHAYTPLQLAAQSGNLKAMAALLSHGADVNVHAGVKSEGQTALSIAMLEGHFDCAKLLLQHGADASVSNIPMVEVAMNKGEYQLAQDLKAHGANVSGVDLSPRPPAFFGGGCDSRPAYWNDQSGQVAEVDGQPGEKLFLHPDYPPKCTDGGKSCDGNAYLVAGDRVVIGTRCDAWTDVQYSGPRSKSWGWVESARLKELGSADQVSLGHHAPVTAAPPELCEATRDRLDEVLLHPDQGAAPFTPVPLNFQNEEELPPALQREADDFGSTEIANALIRGVRAKVVVRSSGGTCRTSTFDVWTHDFKKQVYADANEDAFVSEELENRGTDTYLLATNSRSHDVVLYGFTRNLDSTQFCTFRLAPRKPQQVIQAEDPELCNAVRDGKAEQVQAEEGEPFEVAAEALGADTDVPGGQWNYMLGSTARADIYNDGHPMSVAIVTGGASSGAGCGAEYQTAWPVVLGKDDMPDRTLKKIEAADEEAHLIRYHGTIYVETNSAEGSSSHNHDVWKVSRTGVTKMCSYLPVRYDIK